MFGNSGNWVLSGAVSAIFHVAVIGILLCSSSPVESEEPEETRQETNTLEKPSSSAAPEQLDDEKLRRIKEMVGETADNKVSEKQETIASSTAKSAEKTKESSPAISQAADTPQKQEAKKTSSASEAGVYIYRVKQGDTLSKIAARCDSTIGELAKLNKKPLSRLQKLWVGQSIKTPRPVD